MRSAPILNLLIRLPYIWALQLDLVCMLGNFLKSKVKAGLLMSLIWGRLLRINHMLLILHLLRVWLVVGSMHVSRTVPDIATFMQPLEDVIHYILSLP